MNPFSSQHLLPVQTRASSVIEKILSRDFVRCDDAFPKYITSSDIRPGGIPSYLGPGEACALSTPLFGPVKPPQSLCAEIDMLPQLAQPILNIIYRSQNTDFQKQCRSLLRARSVFPICRVELIYPAVPTEEQQCRLRELFG